MIPPETINVLDKWNGFTAVTDLGGRPYPSLPQWRKIGGCLAQRAVMQRHDFQTLWRPGAFIKDPTGKLLGYIENSFYQNNNDVTMAFYAVKTYQYIVGCWFDNETGLRIA